MLGRVIVENVIGYLSWVSLLSGLGWFYYSEARLEVLATKIPLKTKNKTKFLESRMHW